MPFAHWLVSAIRPRLVVELGTHNGVSYAAFCSAVARSDHPARCFAVDTWEGDAHAGLYGDAVFREFRAFHDAHFAAFSTLLRKTFDAALADFADGTIDLLHIDGFHSYEAVRHDFETWQPKLSPRAVVLFHDIAVLENGFGVWRFWDEISAGRPHFRFRHSFGLGALATGPDVPEAFAALCAEPPEVADAIRGRFAVLGDRNMREFARVSGPPPAAPQADIAGQRLDIKVVERFSAPAFLHAVRLPRDALARGADGVSVWIVAADGQDWRHGRIRPPPDGGETGTVAFSAFSNATPRYFHLLVTGPALAGPVLPFEISRQLSNSRAPIELGTPDEVFPVPYMPPRGLFLVPDEGEAP